MTSNQNSKRAMYRVLEELLDETPSTFLASMPNFVPLFTTFKQHLSAIGDLNGKQNFSRLGYAQEKEEAKDKMILAAADITNRARAYATNSGNQVLFEQLNIRKSRMERISDNNLTDYVELVTETLTPLLPDLVDYGVTAAMLTELDDLLGEFEAFIPQPRHQIANRVVETTQLKQLFVDTDAILAQMTKIVEMVQYSNPDFYSKYNSNKRIVDHGYRKLSATGFVFDTNNMPLFNVTVFVPQLQRTFTTSKEGRYEMKRLEAGTYDVWFQRPGYDTVKDTLFITQGITTKMDVVLTSASETLKVA